MEQWSLNHRIAGETGYKRAFQLVLTKSVMTIFHKAIFITSFLLCPSLASTTPTTLSLTTPNSVLKPAYSIWSQLISTSYWYLSQLSTMRSQWQDKNRSVREATQMIFQWYKLQLNIHSSFSWEDKIYEPTLNNHKHELWTWQPTLPY